MQNTYRNGFIGRSIKWSFTLSDGVIGEDYDTSASASITYDEWIELKLIIDLDNDLLEQYYNGRLLWEIVWALCRIMVNRILPGRKRTKKALDGGGEKIQGGRFSLSNQDINLYRHLSEPA